MRATIAYLCSSVSWGGLEMNQLRNALWMKERGHTVFIFCIPESPVALQAKALGLDIVAIHRQRKYYDFRAARLFRHLLTRCGVTHLILRDTRDISMAATARFRMGKRLHVSYFMEMQLGVQKKNLLHSLRFRFIDLWACPLSYLEKQVRTMTHFKNTLVQIPSGLELAPFLAAPTCEESRKQLELPPNRFVFGLIGRFDPQKGQQLVLKAFEQLEDAPVDLVFLGEPTVGEGAEYYQTILDEIAHHGWQERVFIRPFRKDTAVFYAAIDVLIMATKAESIGMVTLEALASGTPVLGSDRGGTPEILAQEKGGKLFISQDANDLAKQMRSFIDSPRHYNPENLRKLVAPNDHQAVCEQVEAALGIPSPRSSQSL